MTKLDDLYIEETIRRAKAGDTKAGLEYLELCMFAVSSGAIGPPLQSELLKTLETMKILFTDKTSKVRVDGLIAEAFLIKTSRGRPANEFPDWHRQLMATDFLMKSFRIKRYRIRNYVLLKLAGLLTPPRRPDVKDLDRMRARYKGGAMETMDDWSLFEIARDVLSNDPDLIWQICSGEILRE